MTAVIDTPSRVNFRTELSRLLNETCDREVYSKTEIRDFLLDLWNALDQDDPKD